MKQKPVIQLDADGYMVGTTWADESPAEPGVYLIPGGCIEADWPSVPEGQRARWTGNAWALEAIPAPAPDPVQEPPSRADVIRSRLAEIDQQSIRPARVVAAALAAGQTVPAFDADKLATLETEAAALRAELAAMA